MTKLKLGDKVRVITNRGGKFRVEGFINAIVDVDYGEFFVRLYGESNDINNESNIWLFTDCELERI